MILERHDCGPGMARPLHGSVSSQDLARATLGEVPGVDYGDAVHDDEWDANGILVRVGPGSLLVHDLRIEDRDVGNVALGDRAAILEAKPLRGQRGHLAN